MLSSEQINNLFEALGTPDTLVRLKAQNVLVQEGESAVEPLIGLARTGSIRQVTGAVGLLAQFGDQRAIEPLIALLDAEQPLVRLAAAKGLAEFKVPRVVEALLSKLNDPNELVQTWAISSLSALHDEQAVKPLLAFLDQGCCDELCYMVIRALGDLGDPSAIDSIVRFLDSENRHIKRDARNALVKLGYLDEGEAD